MLQQLTTYITTISPWIFSHFSPHWASPPTLSNLITHYNAYIVFTLAYEWCSFCNFIWVLQFLLLHNSILWCSTLAFVSSLSAERSEFFLSPLMPSFPTSVNYIIWCIFVFLTLTVLVATNDAQWEGMGDVGSARYELALLPPCLTTRVLSYSN